MSTHHAIRSDKLFRAQWRKSTRSGSNGGACVEIANLTDGSRAVRDSKDPYGPALIFPPAVWAAFFAGVREGEFD